MQYELAYQDACMTMQDHGRLYGALFALRILARKYEFKDEEDRAPLTGIVNGAFPVLLQLFQAGHCFAP